MNKQIIASIVLLVFLASCTQQAENSVKSNNEAKTSDIKVQEVKTADTGVQKSEDKSTATVVRIKNFAFLDQEATIKVGDTVLWKQEDNVPHTVTATNAPEEFNSGTLNQGKQWSFTFTKPGVYEYFCEFHPGMKGTVIVD